MAKIFGEIDSFKRLISHLKIHQIENLHSLDDISNFLKNCDSNIKNLNEIVRNEYASLRNAYLLELQKLREELTIRKEETRNELENEKRRIANELEAPSTSGFLLSVINGWLKLKNKRRLAYLSCSLEKEIQKKTKKT